MDTQCNCEMCHYYRTQPVEQKTMTYEEMFDYLAEKEKVNK